LGHGPFSISIPHQSFSFAFENRSARGTTADIMTVVCSSCGAFSLVLILADTGDSISWRFYHVAYLTGFYCFYTRAAPDNFWSIWPDVIPSQKVPSLDCVQDRSRRNQALNRRRKMT
jgi:hypothetical protein